MFLFTLYTYTYICTKFHIYIYTLPDTYTRVYIWVVTSKALGSAPFAFAKGFVWFLLPECLNDSGM